MSENRGLWEVRQKSLLFRLNNAAWETALGINTRGMSHVDLDDAYHYAAMGYRTVNRILDATDLGPDDVLVDIGCGKGRVLCAAARRRLRSVVGVEFDAELAEQARRNATSMRMRRTPISVHTGDAAEFDYRDGTVFCLFNPFGVQTLEVVLAKIERETAGRSIRLVYANPIHDDVVAAHGPFQRYRHWPALSNGVEHAVSFYRT